MLHLASAPYLTGRSDALLKLKPYLDAEAVVVGYQPGRGKLAGQVGALEVEAPRRPAFLRRQRHERARCAASHRRSARSSPTAIAT